MLELHRLLLGDRRRNDAFAKAMKRVIVPGKTVVADVGSGTGFLSFLAEKYGARECFLYERNPAMLALSRRIAEENGMRLCRFFKTHSTEVKKPTRADLVISETLGNYALEENILETMNDARRFLKPGGAMIPQSIKQFAAPVTSSRLYDELNVWDKIGHGLNFDAAKEICMNNMYVKDVIAKDLLGSGKQWDVVDFRKKNSSIRAAILEWTVKSDKTLYGFALWWEATLFKNIMLSTSPFDPPTHWKQIYLPLTVPMPVRPSDTMRLSLRSDSRYEVKIDLEWKTEILDRHGKITRKIRQDMKNGYL